MARITFAYIHGRRAFDREAAMAADSDAPFDPVGDGNPYAPECPAWHDWRRGYGRAAVAYLPDELDLDPQPDFAAADSW